MYNWLYLLYVYNVKLVMKRFLIFGMLLVILIFSFYELKYYFVVDVVIRIVKYKFNKKKKSYRGSI